MKLRIICSWCKKIIGEKEVTNLPDRLFGITHSICPACSDELSAELEEIQKQSDQTKTN